MILKLFLPTIYRHHSDFSFMWSGSKWRFSRHGWIKWGRTWGRRRRSTLLNSGSSEIIWAFSSTIYNTTCRFDDLDDVDDSHLDARMAYPRLNPNPSSIDLTTFVRSIGRRSDQWPLCSFSSSALCSLLTIINDFFPILDFSPISQSSLITHPILDYSLFSFTSIQVDVIESQFSRLVDKMRGTRDFEECRVALDTFIAKLQAQCFLQERTISKCIGNLIKHCEALARWGTLLLCWSWV